MTVIDKSGDIFSSDADVLAHGVNVLGVMGAGIAAQFARRYPVMYDRYKEICADGLLKTGRVYAFQRPNPSQYVFNLATQKAPGADAKLHLVEEAFSNALFIMTALDLKSIALPRIGAGIGGLDWDEVRSELERVSSYYPNITVELWTYDA